jgi:hypothetical protein
LIFFTFLEAAKMWFAKWFGGRDDAIEADEPARFAPPEVPRPAQPTAQPVHATAKANSRPAPKQGFDPYNSGSFERRNAWERINRR